MLITIVNNTNISFNKNIVLKTINNICDKSRKYFKIEKNEIIDVVLTDNKEIKKLNKKYRKINKPTDVLTFGFYNDNKFKLGEIYINIEIFKDDVINDKIYELFIHGLLHLHNIHHNTMKKWKEVVLLQKKILSSI